MDVNQFYAIVSGICFALCGLWWTVVADRKEWARDPLLRRLAGGVYASFLIPGVMSLGAQIGGENKLVWRATFAIAALLGMYFTFRLSGVVRKAGHAGAFSRGRWVVGVVYALVFVISLFPALVGFSGLTPIQVEAGLLCIIILLGHGLAWEMMMQPAV